MLCVLVCAVVLVSAPSQLLPLADMELPALKDEMQARGQKPLQEGKLGRVGRATDTSPRVGRAGRRPCRPNMVDRGRTGEVDCLAQHVSTRDQGVHR